MKKKGLIVAILIMAVGFAAVSTTLVIKGSAKVKENEEDFEIIFTKATLDNVDVYNDVVSQDKKTITFTSNDLMSIGDTSTLNYEITNNSSNYDAEVKINCGVKENTKAEYTSITNSLEDNKTVVKAKESLSGALTITLDKTSTESITEEYVCTLEFNAVERETLGIYIDRSSLYNMMKSLADKEKAINFSVRSGTSGTNGIYTTTNTNTGTEVYYYRGNVDNNIIYNNMCWKIIRTTETGGVKLIYNGTQTDGKCSNTGENSQLEEVAFNPDGTDNAYVGYMYGSAGSTTYKATHTNTNDSIIKTYIDNWFSGSFDDSAQEMLEDTIFCNDRNTKAYDANLLSSGLSGHGDLGYGGTNKTIYGAAFRASYYAKAPNPSLICKNTNGTVDENNDSFTVSEELGNGKLTYPVGLITLDEAVYAGFNTFASNEDDYEDINNYLYTGKNYWTLSPVSLNLFYAEVDNTKQYFGVANLGFVHMNGYIRSTYGRIGVRPVISLKSGTQISEDGSGTVDDPYVVI